MPSVHGITNEIPQPISDAFLRKKYSITEQYSKEYPEDSAKVLSAVRSTEEALRAMARLEQTQKEVSCGLTRLEKDTKILRTQQVDLIALEKENTQALQNLANSSSEMKEMTSNIANVVSNCANRIFNPVRNGFYFLTGYREPAAVLPRENQLAIEDNLENTIPNTDPTNQTSGDVKKKITSLLIFFAVSGGLYFLPAGERRS